MWTFPFGYILANGLFFENMKPRFVKVIACTIVASAFWQTAQTYDFIARVIPKIQQDAADEFKRKCEAAFNAAQEG